MHQHVVGEHKPPGKDRSYGLGVGGLGFSVEGLKVKGQGLRLHYDSVGVDEMNQSGDIVILK